MKQRKIKWIFWVLSVLFFCINVNIYVEAEEIELDSAEQVEYVEGEEIGEIDEYVDGIYNTSEYARADISGVIRLAKSDTKLYGSYTTSYTYAVDKIGVKNVKLQYKSSLGIWYNLVTLDDRYFSNMSTYTGSFSTTGTFGRTYRLKCTHYITDDGTTKTRDNVTGELTF